MKIQSLFLLAVLAIFYGCSKDTPVTPGNQVYIDVNGKVLDYFGSGVQGVPVVIGNTFDTTDAQGSFSFSNISSPYDVAILDSGFSASVKIFDDVTTPSPQLLLLGDIATLQHSAIISVQMPPINTGAGERGKIIFTGERVNLHDSISASGNLRVNWNGSSTFSGRLIVFVYTEVNGKIASYEKFGYEDITITSNQIYSKTFSAAELEYNPPEAVVSGSIIYGTHTVLPSSALKINFGNYTNSISGTFFEEIRTNSSFSYVVPGTLPVAYKIDILGFCRTGSIRTTGGIVETYSPGNTGNTLVIPPRPALIAPGSGSTNVDKNTVFNVMGTSGGVYSYSFYSDPLDITIVTSKNVLQLAGTSYSGFTLPSAAPFSWSVQQMPGINSTDEYVKEVLAYNPHYKGYASSESSNFTTRP